jgi:hypothetical protein
MKLLIATYFIAAFVGTGFSQNITTRIFGDECDETVTMCLLIGVVITTVVFVLMRQRINKCKFRLIVASLMGFFAFTPGYLVAVLLSLIGIMLGNRAP